MWRLAGEDQRLGILVHFEPSERVDLEWPRPTCPGAARRAELEIANQRACIIGFDAEIQCSPQQLGDDVGYEAQNAFHLVLAPDPQRRFQVALTGSRIAGE